MSAHSLANRPNRSFPTPRLRPVPFRLGICLSLWLVVLGAGCTEPGPAPPQSARSQPVVNPDPDSGDRQLVDERNVRPGINDTFLEDGAAESYAKRFEVESREIFAQRAALVDALGLHAGMAVADVGAGTGVFLKPLSEAVSDGGKLYSVDISAEFVGWLRQRAAREGLHNVEVVQNSEKSVELPDGSVDLVFVCDTYHHFEFPLNTLASIHRALRDGGQLVVVDFHRIEGVSRPWLLEHVRAGEDVFTREIEESGFRLTERRDDLLQENYFLRFERVSR
ncbi:MAG: class I SAM-dependent methyltransferase [Planctomycetes bacterium]|nr:class I SAM-dependent methyltransferase [Planctomycetota bacterium]